MKIDAEDNRYHGDEGWGSDPQLFAQVAVTWRQWIGHAGEHLHAAQILLPQIEARQEFLKQLRESNHRGTMRLVPCLDGIYFMHCAVSIENAFKGVIAATNADEITREITQKRKIPKILLGHDLVELGKKAAFAMGADEEYTLAFLSRYGTWAGRYPLPVINADNALTRRLSDGNHYLMAGYRTDHVPRYVRFSEAVYTWARALFEPAQSTNAEFETPE